MSQRQIALGICAQATVSLIEKRNKCPSLRILTKLCQRLGISINDVVIKPHHQFGLINVEQAVFQHRHGSAEVNLRKISQSMLNDRLQKGCYFCNWGSIYQDKRDDSNALYAFNRALSLESYRNDQYYRAWANLGVGQIYLKHHDYSKALEFANLADGHLQRQIINRFSEGFKRIIKLRIELGQLFHRLSHFKQSNEINAQTITALSKVHSMYRMSDVYAQISRNYDKLNDPTRAKLAQLRSKIFAKIYQDPRSLRI